MQRANSPMNKPAVSASAPPAPSKEAAAKTGDRLSPVRMKPRGLVSDKLQVSPSSSTALKASPTGKRMHRRRSGSPKKAKSHSSSSATGSSVASSKHLSQHEPQNPEQQQQQEDNALAGLCSPQEFLERILERRGHNTRKYFTLQSAYACDPTPLQRASFHTFFFSLLLQQEPGGSHLETVRAILSSGVSPNGCNSRGETFLHSLARLGQENHIPICKLLITEFQCSVQVSDDEGRTPLHEACSRRRRLLQHRPQRRRSSQGGSNNNHQPLPPCFEIVDMIVQQDVNLFFMKDSSGRTPLMYVDPQHWPMWLDYLDAKRDELWPRYSSSSKNSISSGLKKQVPPLAALPPNSRPLVISASSAALSPQLAARVVSGRVTPEQAKRMVSRARPLGGGGGGAAAAAVASESDRSVGRSSDDSYIGTWRKRPNMNSSDEDDHYADNVMLGGLQVPTLRYALMNKDYTYNAEHSSSFCNSENQSHSDGSLRQTEGEDTSETSGHCRESNYKLDQLERKLSFPDHPRGANVRDCGSSVSSGEATSESFRADGTRTTQTLTDENCQSSPTRKQSSALDLPGFGDGGGNWSFSSHLSHCSEADTIESQLWRDSSHLGLSSCASGGCIRDEKDDTDPSGDLFLPSFHSQDSSIVSHLEQSPNSSLRSTKGSSNLRYQLDHSSSARLQDSSVRSRTSVISLVHTKFHDPSSPSPRRSSTTPDCQSGATLSPLQLKLQQQQAHMRKEDILSALDIPGLDLRDEEDDSTERDHDIDSLVSDSLRQEEADKDDPNESGSLDGSTKNSMMFL